MKLTMNVSPINGRHTYTDVLDIIVPAGFDSVVYMLNDLVFDNSEMYLADTKEYCERVRREAESRGITVEA